MGRVAPQRPVPLARLLGMGFRSLVDDLHVRLVERGWTDVRESYGFVLLAIGDLGTSTTELAEVLGVSKQAMSKVLDAMEAGGYVRRETSEHDGRVKVVSLAERGEHLLEVVEDIYDELESEWARAIGAGALDQIRSGIEEALRERHDGELPRLRPT